MFKLKIKLGNEAMQSLEDLALTLRFVSIQLERGQREGQIFDVNGNKVGEFSAPKGTVICQGRIMVI